MNLSKPTTSTSNVFSASGWGTSLVVFLTAAATVPLSAQTLPDAGSLLNQIQRSFPAPQLPNVGPEAPPPQVEVLTPKGATVWVREFAFVGNKSISSERLSPILASYLGRPITFDDLRNAASEVSLYYRRQGYVATVSIPKQELRGGILVLRVLESRFGKVVIDSASDGRTDPKIITKIITSAIKEGEPTDMRKLDRGLLIAGDLPGTYVTGGLTAGAEAGLSDLVVLSSRTPKWANSLNIDNSGARSAGNIRALGSFSLANPRGFGESYSANFLKSETTKYGQVSFGMPLGYDGSRLSFSASRMNYGLSSSDFMAAGVTGQSSTGGIDYTTPLVRSRIFNLNFSAGVDAKAFLNSSNGNVVSDYSIVTFNSGFNANLYDDFFGGGVTTANLTLIAGQVDLAGSPNQATVANSTRSEGKFQKLRMGLSRTQNLTQSISLSASINGQIASRNLDSAEKIFAGGADAVRAYPVNEGSGDTGYVAVLEARWKISQNWQATFFIDHAFLKVNEDTNFMGAPLDNSLNYEGAGVAVSWSGPYNSTWRATWAQRIGDNPNPQPNGNDQDGSLTLNRLWMTVNFRY